MSRQEVPRAGLVKAALAGKITNDEGAHALHLSVRQFQRLKVRWRLEGLRGLVHRARGRPSRRRYPSAVRTEIERLMTTTYEGFNDVHLTEKLQQGHALSVSRAPVGPPTSPRPGPALAAAAPGPAASEPAPPRPRHGATRPARCQSLRLV